MALIKGMTVQLVIKENTGVDGFNRPTYEENIIDVNNVLVGTPSSEEITDTLSLEGKIIAYMLAIPKGDSNSWVDTEVILWGERYRTIGKPIQGIEENIPLDWNKKVRVERCE